MSKKNEIESGPTFAGVIFMGIAMAVVGVVLGFVFLSMFPVKALASSKELEGIMTERADRSSRPDDVFYFETPAARSGTWQAQRTAFFNGKNTEVDVTLGDLNAWTSSYFRASPAPVGDDKPMFFLSPKEPKFGSDGSGVLHLSLPLTAQVMDYSKKYLVHARGTFDGDAEFKLDRIYVNNAPVPNIPGVTDAIFGAFMDLFSNSEEFQAVSQAWPQVQAVEMSENSLQLKL